MKWRGSLSILFAAVFAFTSCVSKKKFIEMESGRLEAEELSRKLDTENNEKAARISTLIADFEAMKNELMESNAIKEHHIDSLRTELSSLLTDLNKQTRSLEETSFNLDFEKQRLTDAIELKDRNIVKLQSDVDELEKQLSAKETEMEERNFEINKLNDQAKLFEGQIKTGQSGVQKLQEDLEKAKAATSKLQEDLKNKEAEITRLENQVNLLKKEIGK